MPALVDSLIVAPATLPEREKVFLFLKDNFYPYEPVSQTIGYPEGPPDVNSVRALRAMGEGTVLLAKDPANPGRIVGAACCKVQGVTSPDGAMDEESLPETTRTLWKLFDEVDKAGMKAAGDSWPKGKPVLFVSICCTSVDFRGRGVGKALVRSVVDMAKKLNVGVVTVHCTSPISEHLFSSAGFQRMCTVPYDHIPKAKAGASVVFLMMVL